MESLYSRCQEVVAKTIILAGPVGNRRILALGRVTSALQGCPDIPPPLRLPLLMRVLLVLLDMEREDLRFDDLGFVTEVPHPRCSYNSYLLSELWQLPLPKGWFCADCGEPRFVVDKEIPEHY